MAFPRLSASMILLLYWTASLGRSHDPTSSVLPPPHRARRDLDFEARQKVDTSLSAAQNTLEFIKERIGDTDTRTLSGVMRGLEKVASLAPIIGGLVAPIITAVLAFIPQDDPVFNEVKQGFAEVNRKLDSLSIQISDLATDVEWFNYASVYSQDEIRILNAWKKFTELRDNSASITSEEDKLRLAEIFTRYYENTGTEASVANLYHHLTVSSTSLSGNLNNLLQRKFQCSTREIGKYNLHFSILLWKGMLLNQFYWNLVGFNLLDRDAEHTKMFRSVYAIQIRAVQHCLDHYEEYMRDDVEKISKSLSADDHKAIADKVKETLDNKYHLYNWVVVVYKSKEERNQEFHNMIKIPAGLITVAVSNTQKADEVDIEKVKDKLQSYFSLSGDTPCQNSRDAISQSDDHVGGVLIRHLVKVMFSSYNEKFVQVPEPMKTFTCTINGYYYKTYIHYSQSTSNCNDSSVPCENGGTCKQLLDSNENLCECPDEYYGDRCEVEMEPKDVPEIGNNRTVPDITAIRAKLKVMEDKLETLLNTLNNNCPAQ